MPEVIKNNSDILFVNNKIIEEIKYEALKSSRHMARFLMHLSHEDLIQEMLIAMGKECVVSPNSAAGKSESLQVIEGRLLLVIFDLDGNIVKEEEMAPAGSNLSSIYRLNSTPWHTMIPLTEMVVVHETLQGPFESSSEAMPSWVPSDNSNMKKFIQKILVNSKLV
tara:strand:- start:2725 stop:3222 length:498 start_codon:yes stop_codon:yes gene_type:complete